MNKPEKYVCVSANLQTTVMRQKSAEPNSNSNICSSISTYAKEPNAIFLQRTQPLAASRLCLFFVSAAVHPFASPVNRPFPPSFSFPIHFPSRRSPSHTAAASLPPPLLSYLNCKLQQCRLPEELLNVIRADPVD